ncbi:MAG: hypothetical protein IBX64_06865 [Actinobacteria bacterium]|nr:hypothetical protein [Actinomycetota bacterium]
MHKLSIRDFRWISLVILMVIWLFLGTSPGWAGQSTQGTVSFTVVQSPLEVMLKKPDSISTGDTFVLKATVVNRGDRKLSEGAIVLSIAPPDGIFLSGKHQTKKLGSLNPGQIKTVSWRLKAELAGSYSATGVALAWDRKERSRFEAGTRMEIEVLSQSWAESAKKYLLQQVDLLLLWPKKVKMITLFPRKTSL